MKLSLVVPVYNEEDTVQLFYQAVRNSACLKNYEVEIVFINDGSKDATARLLAALAEQDLELIAVTFSRNFGKEAALLAGLFYASGEAVIPIDVDLQDPIEVIPLLVQKYLEGNDVVLAKRSDRDNDSLLKSISSSWFYRVHNFISEPKIEENVGDFRLISRQVVDAILQLPERKLFMKGVLSWVGFDYAVVEYKRPKRAAGSTKFSGWKLWNLALEGITSFSTWPLRIWTYIGFGVASIAFIYASWMILQKLLWGNPVPGYPSIMTAILFLGGVQLIGIGILGEYIGRIYEEAKGRPRFIVKSVLNERKKVGCERSI